MVSENLKKVSCESIKINKLICHNQCRRDFTNDVKISRYNQLEAVLGDIVSSDTPEGIAVCNFKIRRISKVNLKQDQCFACDQITKTKTKSGEYKVASRVETKDGSVTLTEAMIRNESSSDPWLRTAEKSFKVQTSNSDMWAANVFITNSVMIELFIVIEKYPKKTLCLTRKYQANQQKKNCLFW